MYTINGVEYLNAKESAKFCGMSGVPFKKLRDKEKAKPKAEQLFQEYTLLGKGRIVFFKKAELEAFKKTFVRLTEQ